MRSVVALGDIHFPFANRRALREALAYILYVKPDIVVQLGDLYDMLSYGRFPRSLNGLTPKQEMALGRRQAEEFWTRVREMAGKKAEFYQLRGNHDVRPLKKILTAAPEFEHIVEDYVTKVLTFDGVETSPCEEKELILDNVVYMHGYRKHGTHVTYNHMSTVCGHSHHGGVVLFHEKGRTLFELNAAYLGEPKEMGGYRKQREISTWTTGLGHVDDYGPKAIVLCG